jgi:hypothetical protein
MRGVLRVASALSWVNLIIWGLMCLVILLTGLSLGLVALVSAILIAAIPLNCYAALQLHRSIREPAVKLSHQTPAGIRFVGFAAMFFGILITSQAVTALVHPVAFLESMRQAYAQSNLKNAPTISAALARNITIVMLLLGLAVVVNVQLNFRLLRWYYLVHKSDAP